MFQCKHDKYFNAKFKHDKEHDNMISVWMSARDAASRYRGSSHTSWLHLAWVRVRVHAVTHRVSGVTHAPAIYVLPFYIKE